MKKRIQRCRKCNTEKGKPHTPSCATRGYSAAYPDSLIYTYGTVSDSGSGSSGPCDTGSSSSSSSSDTGGGGGGCE